MPPYLVISNYIDFLKKKGYQSQEIVEMLHISFGYQRDYIQKLLAYSDLISDSK